MSKANALKVKGEMIELYDGEARKSVEECKLAEAELRHLGWTTPIVESTQFIIYKPLPPNEYDFYDNKLIQKIGRFNLANVVWEKVLDRTAYNENVYRAVMPEDAYIYPGEYSFEEIFCFLFANRGYNTDIYRGWYGIEKEGTITSIVVDGVHYVAVSTKKYDTLADFTNLLKSENAMCYYRLAEPVTHYDGEEVSTKLNQALSELKGNDYTLPIKWIADEYINGNNGAIVPYTGWKRTDYIDCDNLDNIYVTTTQSTDNEYNAWYDESKNYISKLYITKQSQKVKITKPSNAKYMILSCAGTTTITLDVTEKSLNGFADKIQHEVGSVNNSLSDYGMTDKYDGQMYQGSLSGTTETTDDTRIRSGWYAVKAGTPIRLFCDSDKNFAIILFNSAKSSVIYDSGWKTSGDSVVASQDGFFRYVMKFTSNAKISPIQSGRIAVYVDNAIDEIKAETDSINANLVPTQINIEDILTTNEGYTIQMADAYKMGKLVMFILDVAGTVNVGQTVVGKVKNVLVTNQMVSGRVTAGSSVYPTSSILINNGDIRVHSEHAGTSFVISGMLMIK